MTTGTPTRRVFGLHYEFEARRPDYADMERSYEADRAATYETSHGTLDGYRPRRAFPCRGVLREIDQTKVMYVVACDACGFQITVRRDQADRL